MLDHLRKYWTDYISSLSSSAYYIGVQQQSSTRFHIDVSYIMQSIIIGVVVYCITNTIRAAFMKLISKK